MNQTSIDAVIVGAGPNGLTAAAVLSLAGLSVLVLERNATIGGGSRTEELTLPGYAHDVCGAIHPVGVVSPIFRKLKLTVHGLEWVSAPIPLAHPFDDGSAAILSRDIERTASALGSDGPRWAGMLRPFVERSEAFFTEILKPVRVPRHPLLMARFGRLGLQSCERLARSFDGMHARALLAGNAAHSFLALSDLGSASFGLVLAVAAHAVDWPCARGGSQAIVNALASIAIGRGCEIRTGVTVRTLADVPPSRAVLFDVTPRQLERIAGSQLSSSYRARLRAYRYGVAAFKIDYALADRIPWRARECDGAATVHVVGSYDDVVKAESDAACGRVPEKPFVLVAQQSHVDPTRAPDGRHTGWAYCHVPHGSDVDMTERLERQIERFAPGFRDTILARHVMSPAALEAHNPNLVGGDIGGGSNAMSQFFARPVLRWNPYRTSNERLFLCSSSTPPGGGVHGMCGYWAARTVLRRLFGKDVPPDLVV